MESIKAMSWVRNLSDIYANLDEENQALTEAVKKPKFSSTLIRGKRYVVLAIAHQGYEFYEVDNKTKLKDFNDTNGRYYDWIKNTKKLDESDEISAIIKVEES